jgi:hypothetical protein
MSVTKYQPSVHNIPEDGRLQLHGGESLKSHISSPFGGFKQIFTQQRLFSELKVSQIIADVSCTVPRRLRRLRRAEPVL